MRKTSLTVCVKLFQGMDELRFQNQVTYAINPLYQMSQRLKKVRLCLHSLVRFCLGVYYSSLTEC